MCWVTPLRIGRNCSRLAFRKIPHHTCPSPVGRGVFILQIPRSIVLGHHNKTALKRLHHLSSYAEFLTTKSARLRRPVKCSAGQKESTRLHLPWTVLALLLDFLP